MPLRWKIYAVIYSLVVLVGAVISLLPESRVYAYYQILLILDKSHWINLFLFYFANLIDLLSLVPLLLFAFRKRWLSQDFWRLIFAGRIIGLVMGHNYEYNILASLLMSNLTRTIIAIAVTILISLPSLIAQFIYSFRENKITQIKK